MFNSRAYKFLCLIIFVCTLVKLTQVSFKSNENINDVLFQGNL